MKRRNLFYTAPAALAGAIAYSQESEPEPVDFDITGREFDLLPFEDGLVIRDAEGADEIPVPLIWAPNQRVFGPAYAATEADGAPRLALPPLVDYDEQQTLAFNIYLPEPGDDYLFEPNHPGGQLVVAPSPSFAAGAFDKNGQRNSNTADGSIRKKYDYQIARFEAHGIVKKDLNPTCVPGLVEGIWMKVDLWGPLLGSVNRWKTYAEGSVGRIVNQPGQYQFHWNKPNICGIGTTNRDAIYNGILKMLQDLVNEVLGAVGKFLDKLLKASPSIAALIADNLVKWITKNPATTPTTPGPTNPGPTNPGTNPTPPPAAGTFSLSASPTSAAAKRGSSVRYSISVTPQNGFRDRVTLTAAGRTGSRVTFSPSVLSSGSGRSTLTVTTAKTSPLGNHQIQVKATSAKVTKEISLGITIQS